jgi:heme oxygenase (mycobilin-producing)
MFIALSTFTIANNMAPEVKKAFQERPHLVDNAPGYRKMEVLCPQDAPNEIWLITYWTDEESYRVWHKNHLRESHSNIPKGLKLVPRSSKVRFFTHIAD